MDFQEINEQFNQRFNQGTKSIEDRNREFEASQALPVLMRKVYTWMCLALGITALTAYGAANSPTMMEIIYSNQIFYFGLILAELGLVFYISARLEKISLTTGTLLFALYSALNGLTLAVILFAYSPMVITKTFLVTAGTFGAMAFVGYTTKRDLSNFGGLLIMALIGIIIASVVNIFIKSETFDLIICYVGVIIFVGLTAWDVQKIKTMLQLSGDVGEAGQKIALRGALALYLDFINLFLYLLRIFGRNK